LLNLGSPLPSTVGLGLVKRMRRAQPAGAARRHHRGPNALDLACLCLARPPVDI